jgi:hypothetical protein
MTKKIDGRMIVVKFPTDLVTQMKEYSDETGVPITELVRRSVAGTLAKFKTEEAATVQKES